LYKEQGLTLRHKRPKRNKAAQLRQPKTLAQRVNQIWSMDFVSDSLFDGRKLRMLKVIRFPKRSTSKEDLLKGADSIDELCQPREFQTSALFGQCAGHAARSLTIFPFIQTWNPA
jgi:hypothetical protein